MNFNDHSRFKGEHALLSASKYHWLNYDEERMIQYFNTCRAAEQGTRLHDFAAQCIKLNQKLPRSEKTLNMYVNDAIGFKMSPEQVLFYSENCFGTTDAICYRNNQLRIHDLKTGVTPANMNQLLIYAALFYLEYNVKPAETQTILRIYQNNAIVEELPDLDTIVHTMDKIITMDRLITKLKAEEV